MAPQRKKTYRIRKLPKKNDNSRIKKKSSKLVTGSKMRAIQVIKFERLLPEEDQGPQDPCVCKACGTSNKK